MARPTLLALALVALIAIAAARVPFKRVAQFQEWKAQYGKSYATPSEEAYRLNVFHENMNFIEGHDAEEKGFTVAMNQFGDLTVAEFSSMVNGFRMPKNKVYNTDPKLATVDLVGLPASVDWRTKNAVTPVKNQGQCGSCWSFSTTGSTEGAHALATGNLVSLSEQNLIDCSTAEGNQGCNGGIMDDAFTYIIKNNGIDTEASYPYQAQGPLQCRFKTANIGATLSSFKDVQKGSELALQAASGTVGPISVAIDASHNSFQFYQSGVYYEPACSTTQLDHGVLVVGYGNSSGTDYWIVKNSWGTTWGQAGYIWMSRNRNNNCGIATMASYPIAGNSPATSNSGPSASASGPAASGPATSRSASGPAASNSGPSASGPAASHSGPSATTSNGPAASSGKSNSSGNQASSGSSGNQSSSGNNSSGSSGNSSGSSNGSSNSSGSSNGSSGSSGNSNSSGSANASTSGSPRTSRPIIQRL